MRYVSSMIIDSLFVPFSTSLTRYHSSFSSMYQANENGGNAPNVFEEVAADQAAAANNQPASADHHHQRIPTDVTNGDTMMNGTQVWEAPP